MPGIFDRIKDTWVIASSTTISASSTFTVSGSPASGFQTFSSRYATNEGNIPVAIVSQTANQWMVCWCTYNPGGATPNQLRVDTIIFSSSADGAVTFSAATADVFVTASSRAVPGLREINTFTANNYFSGNVGIGSTTIDTPSYIKTAALGGTAGNTQRATRVLSQVTGNDLLLDATNRRHTTGTDWTGTSIRIQRTIDVTANGFIDFGVDTIASSVGLGFGTGTTTFMSMDNSGRLLVGSTTSVESISGVATAKNQIAGTDATAAVAVYRYSADANGPNFILAKSRGATVGSQSAVSTNDELGSILFAGSEGVGFRRAAAIQAFADPTPGTAGAADMPGRLSLATTADGAAVPTERVQITSTGDIRLIGDPTALATTSLGYRGMPSNERSTGYTLALSDAGKAIVKSVATAFTVTIPANTTVAFPIGTTVVIDHSYVQATNNTTYLTVSPAADVGIVGAGQTKDIYAPAAAQRFKDKLMAWPSQTTLRKLRNKGTTINMSTAPTRTVASPSQVTLTLPSTNPFTINDFVIVAGGTNAAYNGTHRVASVSGLTLTYWLATDPGASSGSYTATPADLWVISGDYTNSTTA